jgi:hypothetical protein
MNTTVENTLLEQRKQVCFDLQQIASTTTKVESEIVFAPFYETDDYTHEVCHCSNHSIESSAIIEAIDNAEGRKIVSDDDYKGNTAKILSVPKRVPLNAYFTDENEKKSNVIRHEKALILACGYHLNEGYYFAIPFPPGTTNPSGIFFLVAKNEAHALAIERNISILLNELSKYFM